MRSLLLTLLLLTPFAAPAQQSNLRILVDASKDGGLWWFPQGRNGFDAKQHHQGKPLADLMRSKGREVVELGRGGVGFADST